MEDNLTVLYCVVDDFCKELYPIWESHLLAEGLKKRRRKMQLSPSELMSLVIYFQASGFRNFKTYYVMYVQKYLREAFPKLVSYSHFVNLMKSIMVPLCLFTQCLKGEKTGLYFVDSLLLRVCHIKREKQNRVFKGLAKKAKSTMGWFFGFKLHLLINHKGEMMAFKLTAGNVDDRQPVSFLAQHLTGKLVGDKGYISHPLFVTLFQQGLQLITKIKKNMKNKLMNIKDKLFLQKRGLIECVNDQLKNKCHIEHSRHRSVYGFIVNLLAAISAYALQNKKPSLR
jgi:hypothetical protein